MLPLLHDPPRRGLLHLPPHLRHGTPAQAGELRLSRSRSSPGTGSPPARRTAGPPRRVHDGYPQPAPAPRPSPRSGPPSSPSTADGRRPEQSSYGRHPRPCRAAPPRSPRPAARSPRRAGAAGGDAAAHGRWPPAGAHRPTAWCHDARPGCRGHAAAGTPDRRAGSSSRRA
ncbi:hypothetical protein LUX31_01855 [Streptomyces sp. GQFP]|nr:hypothetical protein LUX31_01855 [Streptomyces sp. GQFP]